MSSSESNEPNDVFISYSHIDNRPWGAGQNQWVSEFHQGLATRVGMLLGRDVRMWRDEKLAGNDEFTQRILDELRKSRSFVCVISPRYLNSEWCVRELQTFLTLAAGSASGSNVFKVTKTPVEPRSQPPELREFLGYEFFLETASGKTHEFYPSDAADREQKTGFWQQLDDLAQDIGKTLAARSLLPDPKPAGRKIIYLAQTTTDLRVTRDNVKRELVQRGHSIVPDRELPPSVDELLPLVDSSLAQACLTVHPVGARYGFIPEGESRSVIELQIDAATKHNGQSQHVIWVAPDATPQMEPKQHEFVDKLRRVYTERIGTELLEEKSLEVLKTRLSEKLEERKPAPPPVSASPRVYLICERGDLTAIRPMEEYLRQAGFGVSRSLLDGEEHELTQDHRDTLVCCDAVLVYYGSARQAWLRAKQRDLWKAAGWGRTKDMFSQAVFVASPARTEDTDFASDDFLVLDGRAPMPQALAPFVRQIRMTMGVQQ